MVAARPQGHQEEPTVFRCFACLLAVVVVGLGGCASGPRLSVDPSQAEFPFGASVRADGRLDVREWSTARRLTVDLSDGRRIEVHLQRDRRSFAFAFEGLGDTSIRPVRPVVLMDLWGNRTSRWDDNDWWIRIGRDDCWARGGWGEGDCAQIVPGLEANNLPLQRDQALEIVADFDALRFDESYDDMIGLAFRFVDDTGAQVGIWPLRAEIEDPSTWAPISLAH